MEPPILSRIGVIDSRLSRSSRLRTKFSAGWLGASGRATRSCTDDLEGHLEKRKCDSVGPHSRQRSAAATAWSLLTVVDAP